MKNKKYMYVAIILMIVGFATVATTLFINGSAFIAGDQNSFDHDVIFIEAKNESNENFPISSEGKVITFTSKDLASLNDSDRLLFKVKNKSTQYGANVTIDCSTNVEDEKVLVSFGAFFKGDSVDTHETFIDRQEIKDGYLDVTLIKNVLEPIDVEFTCELEAEAVEREGEIEDDPLSKLPSYTMVSLYGNENLADKTIRSKRIVLGSDEIPNATYTYDLGLDDPTEVKGYLVPIEGGSNEYELVLVSEGRIKPVNTVSMFAGQTITKDTGIQYLDTSDVTDFNGMFTAAKIDNVDLSTIDTSSAIQMNAIFQAANVKDVDLTSWDMSNVKQLNGAFAGSTLENVNMNNWDTSNVSEISQLFARSKLKNVTLDNWDFNKIAYFGGIFDGMQFDNLKINFKNIVKADAMDYLFSNISGNKLDVSGLDTSHIKYTESFFAASTIDEIIIDGMDTSNITNMGSWFNGTKVKTPIDLTTIDFSNVTFINSMFFNFEGPSINISGAQLDKIDEFKVVFYHTKVDTITMNDISLEGITTLYEAFEGIDNVTTININNLNAPNALGAGYMFEDIPVKYVSMKNANMPKVKTFASMFANNTNLETIDLSGINAKNVTNYDYMFSWCTKLKKLDLTDFDTTEAVTVTTYNMFRDTTGLEEVKVSSKWDKEFSFNTFEDSNIDRVTVV